MVERRDLLTAFQVARASGVVLLLGALSGLGCGDRVAVQLALDTSCNGVMLHCGGVAVTELSDASTGQLLQRRCAAFEGEPGRALDSLPRLFGQAGLGAIGIDPGRRVKLSIRVHSPAPPGGCDASTEDPGTAVLYGESTSGARRDFGTEGVPLTLSCRGPIACGTDPRCDRFAASDGDDLAAGTWLQPVASLPRLAALLSPGQTGCLKPGTYEPRLSTLTSGGAAGDAVTLTSVPGHRVQVPGRISIDRTANDLILSGLDLPCSDAFTGPHPLIHASRVVLRDSTVSHVGGPCVRIGEGGSTTPTLDVVIERNVIGPCGTTAVAFTLVRGAHIRDNWVFDASENGISMWPDVDDTVIERNVIVGNLEGVSLGGNGTDAPDRNVIRDNVITHSGGGPNFSAFWPSGVTGTGNRLDNNCLFNPAPNPDLGNTTAIAQDGNLLDTDPLYVDRGAKDFRLRPESPCAGKGPAGTWFAP